MAYKFISLLVVACILSNTEGASTRKSVKGKERIAALYIKDGENGELRFLGGGGGGNSNAQLNQFITQKQNMLEQLRPTTTSGTGSGNWGSGSGNFGSGSGTGIGSGTGSGGVVPIVINAGGTSASSGTTGNNGATNAAIVGASPIAGLLPQIIAQAAVTRGGPNNRRRVNQRRRGNNRRRGNKKGAQIYVVRPRSNDQ